MTLGLLTFVSHSPVPVHLSNLCNVCVISVLVQRAARSVKAEQAGVERDKKGPGKRTNGDSSPGAAYVKQR